MKDQLTLLAETDWDVLIVLDACRADIFQEVVGRGETVRSPAYRTPGWLEAVAPILRPLRALYFSANPVVDRENARLGLGLTTVPLWEALWARLTPLGIPSVHPQAVTGYVLGCLNQKPETRNQKLVVHYLQPHSPYIGRPPLALAQWGRGEHPFVAACHALPSPAKAVSSSAARQAANQEPETRNQKPETRTDWEEVRAAYRGNVELVWEAACVLIGALPGRRIVVTSDHGELLGEDGRFGHEPGWGARYPLLREVPWAVLDGRPADAGDEADTRAKLEALGYLA